MNVHIQRSIKNSKLLKRLGNISIRHKLIGIFLLISLLPILITGMLYYTCFQATITSKISQYSLAELTQTVANIQLKLAEFENISVRLFINKEFNTTLSSYVKAKDNPDASPLHKTIEAYFNEYMISNPDIFAFTFICEPDTQRSIVITKDYYDAFSKLSQHFNEQSAYQNIVKAGGGIVWSSPINLNRSHFVILGRTIKDMTTGESLGILAIIVDEDKIDQLANLNIYNQLNISLDQTENYSIIVNSNGEIVSTPFKEDIGKNIATVMKDIRPLKNLLGAVSSDRDYGSEVNQGSFITEVNHKQTLVTYKTIGSKIGVGGKSGWHLLSLAPTSYLYAEMRAVSLTTLFVGLFFGIIAICTSLYIASLVCDE